MKNELKQIIDKIISISGYCYYDEPEDDNVDTVELHSDEFYGVVFEIDVESLRVSTFMEFFYEEYDQNADLENEFVKEAIENNRWTKLCESGFELFLKRNSSSHIVSVWDDGCFMCPGYVSRVGFYNEAFSELIIKEFVSLCKRYSTNIKSSDLNLRKYIFESVCHQNGVPIDCFFTSNNNGVSVDFSESFLSHESNVENYYFGKEMFLFSALGRVYYSRLTPVKLFNEVHQKCEFEQQELTFFLEELPLLKSQELIITSPHMVMRIAANIDKNNAFTRAEEMKFIVNSFDFLPFSSESFQKESSKMFSNILGITRSDIPLIITEGSTDWKHLKKYYDLCEPGVNIAFLEYEPLNSSTDSKHKIEMGKDSLLEMCRAFSKMEQERILIFIADRDDQKIVNKLSEPEKNYKSWGNKVFSFVLPVPDHRTNTPDICIEHLYTDEELKKYYNCEDGIKRRLFFGNDFDKYGRNIKENLLCVKRNICGEKSISIIDGSSDEKVIRFDDPERINYALSKQKFAELSTIRKESKTYDAFTKVFNIIEEIITDNK